MNADVPMFPMIFPVFADRWLQAMRPYALAFQQAQSAFREALANEGVQRMLMWQPRQHRLLEEAEEECREAQDDQCLRLCCRDLLGASRALNLSAEQMLATLVSSVDWAVTKLLQKGIGGEHVRLWQLGHLDRHAAEDVASHLREELARGAAWRLRKTGLPIVARQALEWVRRWATNMDDERLRGVFADCAAHEVVAALARGDLAGPLSDAEINKLRDRVLSLEADCGRVQGEFNSVAQRVQRTRDRIAKPITDMLDYGDGFGLIALLCWTFDADITATFEPASGIVAGYRHVLHPPHEEYLKTAATDPYFWYIGLMSLFRQSGATLGMGLRRWTIALSRQMIEDPRKVRHMQVPSDAVGTRTMLAKQFAPMLTGIQPTDAVRQALCRIDSQEPLTMLGLLVNHLVRLALANGDSANYRNAQHREAVKHLWTNVIGPYSQEVLEWMADGVTAACEQRQMQISAPDMGDSPLVLEDPVVAIEEPVHVEKEPQTWYYVPNPDAADFKLIPCTASPDGIEESFAAFLREQGISAVVKPASIMGALDYFRTMPEKIRALTPYDDLNGQRWHNLKRGAQRIYVRMESDGRLLFHPYARKEWKPEWVKYAA